MILRLLLFLVSNFAALGLGGWFTGPGVRSEWYVNLQKAPWTPPAWVFGAAWTSIMICFAVYLAFLWEKAESRKKLLQLYGIQWLLNVLWNPLFFYFRLTSLSLAEITVLSLLMLFFLFHYRKKLGWKSALLLPYCIWLLIATSLNGYIVLMN